MSAASLQRASFSSPSSSFLRSPWKFAVPSNKVIKTTAPCPRIDITLPATHLASPPLDRDSKFSIASCRLSSRLDFAGYGFIPFFLRSSSFSIRTLRISSIDIEFSARGGSALGGKLGNALYYILRGATRRL